MKLARSLPHTGNEGNRKNKFQTPYCETGCVCELGTLLGWLSVPLSGESQPDRMKKSRENPRLKEERIVREGGRGTEKLKLTDL